METETTLTVSPTLTKKMGESFALGAAGVSGMLFASAVINTVAGVVKKVKENKQSKTTEK